ncbi:MAG TPA: PAS domain-containing protein, partial [Kiloniellales bacterium]
MNNENKPAISDKRLATLYQYWQSKQGDRLMPARADIDPTEIPKLLPILLLIDVVATVSYRYRLVGTEIVSSAGQDITGKLFDEVLP